MEQPSLSIDNKLCMFSRELANNKKIDRHFSAFYNCHVPEILNDSRDKIFLSTYNIVSRYIINW